MRRLLKLAIDLYRDFGFGPGYFTEMPQRYRAWREPFAPYPILDVDHSDAHAETFRTRVAQLRDFRSHLVALGFTGEEALETMVADEDLRPLVSYVQDNIYRCSVPFKDAYEAAEILGS